jgi:4'-phosphopantetheinyl transferase
VVRDGEIGIDVERIADASPELIEECLGPGEIKPPWPARERGERFAIYWTLEESDIRARGFGLDLPVRRLAFELSDRASPCLMLAHLAGSAANRESLVDDDPACWTFVSLLPTPRHRAAVCVNHPRDAPPRGGRARGSASATTAAGRPL